MDIFSDKWVRRLMIYLFIYELFKYKLIIYYLFNSFN